MHMSQCINPHSSGGQCVSQVWCSVRRTLTEHFRTSPANDARSRWWSARSSDLLLQIVETKRQRTFLGIHSQLWVDQLTTIIVHCREKTIMIISLQRWTCPCRRWNVFYIDTPWNRRWSHSMFDLCPLKSFLLNHQNVGLLHVSMTRLDLLSFYLANFSGEGGDSSRGSTSTTAKQENVSNGENNRWPWQRMSMSMSMYE